MLDRGYAMKKTALVCGAGGFIGHHLIKRLKNEEFWVRGVDLKRPEFSQSEADEFILADLRDPGTCHNTVDRPFDEVYQLAADMGGAGFVFVEDNDAAIMHNSALINLNVLESSRHVNVKKIFYSSSACIYPEYNQMDPDNPVCSEDSAYPAYPDSEYGWEKLFSERLYRSFAKNYGIQVRIARFHNIFGEEGTWDGGREKAPAAICRKVAMVEKDGEIDIWGDGNQTRSFLYISECLEGVRRLMDSDYDLPVNIGSEEMVTINRMADMVVEISGKTIFKNHIQGPQGVRGRNSDNCLIQNKLGWAPNGQLANGLKKTYRWIEAQAKQQIRQAYN